MHASIHVVDAPKIGGYKNSKVIEFIDNYITYILTEEEKHPEGISQ